MPETPANMRPAPSAERQPAEERQDKTEKSKSEYQTSRRTLYLAHHGHRDRPPYHGQAGALPAVQTAFNVIRFCKTAVFQDLCIGFGTHARTAVGNRDSLTVPIEG